MKQVPFLNFIFLVTLAQIQGFSALTPVFVPTGKDVVLDINGTDCSKDDYIIYWRFNKNENLVRFMCHDNKKPTVNKFKNHDRIEITEKTSLKLKNCLKSFSGLYSVVRSFNEEEIVAEYNVTVEDPVSPVHLNVNSVFKSSNLCNLTVTCSTEHSHISSSFTCENETCKQHDGQRTNVTKQGNLLQIYQSNESVTCNHSNHVSWSNSTENIRLSCLQNNKAKDQTRHEILVSIIVCIIILVMIVVVLFFLKRKRSSAKGPKNPESAALQAPGDQPPGPQDALSDTCKSVYSVVQPRPQTKSPGTEANKVLESVYAQVEKPGRSKSPSTPKALGDQPPGPKDVPSDSKSIYSVVQPQLQITSP